MTSSTRLDKIKQLLSDDPGDVFLRYSLAMEQEKLGEHDASEAGLRELAEAEPPYIPAFFMCAQHVTKRGRIEEARAILRDGIEQARQQGDAHAAGEMSEFLAELGGMPS
jgi:tetratricopeptide (TPR) repeat protein